ISRKKASSDRSMERKGARTARAQTARAAKSERPAARRRSSGRRAKRSDRPPSARSSVAAVIDDPDRRHAFRDRQLQHPGCRKIEREGEKALAKKVNSADLASIAVVVRLERAVGG